jgi:hypothetical protein
MALFASISLNAQNSITTVLKAIEDNNTTLKALKETAEAQKLENKTGIYLSGPEIGFNYLWGNPSAIGNRNDLNITQTFDFPTITGMKSKMPMGETVCRMAVKAKNAFVGSNSIVRLIYFNA